MTLEYDHPQAGMKQARSTHKYEFIYPNPPAELVNVWRYRWEFLRRNPEYRADYTSFIQRFGDWFRQRGFWYETETRRLKWSRKDEDYFLEKILPVIAKLCTKWRLGNLLPPDWEFSSDDGTLSTRDGRILYPPTSIAAELNWDFKTMQALLDRGFTGTGDSAERYVNHLKIQFDLNWPLKDLIAYAKRALGYAQENYHGELRAQCLPLPRTRRRFDQYDTYLKVWDLTEQGKTIPEIASLVFPNDLVWSAQQKVRDHLKVAKRLISGYSQEIR